MYAAPAQGAADNPSNNSTGSGYQPDLFAQGPVAAEPCFGRANRVELDASSWVEVVPGALPGSDALFLELHERTAWEQHQRLMFERWVDEPRLHGGVPSLDGDLAGAVATLRHRLSARYQRSFDGGWVALYRDGSDSVAWHGDSIGANRHDAVVAVLSLGAVRTFRLRPNPNGAPGAPSRSWKLASGDLIVMGGACQRDWQHSVPKARHAGPRISLQFRSPGWDGRTRGRRS